MKDAGDLGVADLCRVYAAAGTPVVFTPDMLRRLAALMDEHTRYTERALQSARALNRHTLHTFVRLLVVNLGVLVITISSMLL
jgi:hypothetical protein